MKNQNNKSLEFLKSSFSPVGKYESIEDILKWLKKRKQHVDVKIEKTLFSKLDKWQYEEKLGIIKHETSKFFSIDGIMVSTNWGGVNSWQQPIINQSEIGFLGIIVKEFDGILHFLMQAKIEPGNKNYVQLSPKH